MNVVSHYSSPDRVGGRDMSLLEGVRRFLARALALAGPSPHTETTHRCGELEQLCAAYTQALHDSTEAHRRYVEALQVKATDLEESMRCEVDRADDVLSQALEKLKDHRAIHGCDRR